MTEEELRYIIDHGEHLTLECKRAKKELPKSIWETYSAFANTVGGLIVLGVEEDKCTPDMSQRFTITGVADHDKVIADFWNTINSDKVSANVVANDNVETVSLEGLTVVCIHVPQAHWRTKPVYLNGNVYKGSYKRNHSGDYHCSESEVKAMIRDANDDGNDGILLEGYTMDDIDMDTIHAYRTQFRTVNPDHPWNDIDDKAFLLCLGGYTTDRITHHEGLTMAGLLMYGKGLSIRERFANFRMEYLDMSNLVEGERYRDRLTYDGLWENNLYRFFRTVMPKLTFELPRPFHLKGGQRIEDTPQMEAVREAFTNAIIHADMFISGGILRVEKHDDRLCLRNPGNLKLPIEQIFKGGNSKARNPRIQNMLRMIGYGENIGSGFPKILSAWKDAGWAEPTLEDRLELNEVVITLPIPIREGASDTKGSQKSSQKKFAENTENKAIERETSGPVSHKVSQKGKQRISQKKYEMTKELVFRHTVEDPHVTMEQIAQYVGKSLATVKKCVRDLKEEGRIVRVGSRRSGYWETDNKR